MSPMSPDGCSPSTPSASPAPRSGRAPMPEATPAWRQVSPEVFYAEGEIAVAGAELIDVLRRAAAASPKRRARLCAHPGTEDLLHEMLIVLGRDSYVAPHRHIGKSESFHLIDGALA